MQQEAECTASGTPEVPTVSTSGNYTKAEPQMSCGDSHQTEPKASSVLHKAVPVPDIEKNLNNESRFRSNGDERMASFHIGEQCLTGIIPKKATTYELGQARLKSATYPSDTKGRSPVAGPAHQLVRPKYPDRVLPSVARAASPTEVIKSMDTIDSLFSTPWGSTYDQETSLWIPDVSITSLDRICSSEYQHTTNPKPLRVTSPGDVDHTCSAVCADDPTCVTYHTMADTIASEMPNPDEKGHISSTVKPVNHNHPVSHSVSVAPKPKVAANVRYPWNNKRPPYSINLALFTTYTHAITPILYLGDGLKAIIRENSKKVEESTDNDTNRHDRRGKYIPIYVPKQCTTDSALTAVLPVSTAFVFGKNAFQQLENGWKGPNKSQGASNQDPKANMNETVKSENRSTCSLGFPQRNLNQTQSALSAILIPSTAPILAESMEMFSPSENSESSLIGVERAQSALRSLLLTTIVPVLGKEVDTITNPEPSNTDNVTQKHGSPLTDTPVPVTTKVPENKENGGNVSVKPVVGSLMSLATRRHDSSTCTALSSLLVTTTSVILGEAVEDSCIELTEIELSEKEPEAKTKVNHRKSFLDILFCRRRK